MRSAVLDDEIVCLNEDGKLEFRDLLFRRGEPRIVAVDLLWSEGQDLRYSPLTERKHKLQTILPTGGDRILYCDHIEHDGLGLFQLACDNDLRADIVYGIITLKPLDGRSVVSNSRMVMHRHNDHRGCKGQKSKC